MPFVSHPQLIPVETGEKKCDPLVHEVTVVVTEVAEVEAGVGAEEGEVEGDELILAIIMVSLVFCEFKAYCKSIFYLWFNVKFYETGMMGFQVSLGCVL